MRGSGRRPGPSGGVDRTFLIQLSIVALTTTAVNSMRPMVTYRALDLGAGPLEVGVMAAAFSVAPVASALAIGRLVDGFGEVWFIRAGVLIIACGALLAATVGSLALLAVSQIVTGTGHVMNLIAGQTLVGHRGGRLGRDHRYGYYATMGSLGHLLGPLMSAWVVGVWVVGGGDNAQAAAFVTAAAVTVLAFMLALRLPWISGAERAAASAGTGQEERRGLMRTAWGVLRLPGVPTAMAVSMIVISSVDILIAYLPLYGEARGLSVGLVGLLLAIRAGASMAVRAFMGFLIERLGRTVLLVMSMTTAAVGVGFIPLSSAPAVLCLLMFLAGLGLGLGQPITMSWIAHRSPDGLLGTALGVRLTGNRLALVVVPLSVGAVAGAAGVSVIFWLAAGALGAGAVAGYASPPESGPSQRPAG